MLMESWTKERQPSTNIGCYQHPYQAHPSIPPPSAHLLFPAAVFVVLMFVDVLHVSLASSPVGLRSLQWSHGAVLWGDLEAHETLQMLLWQVWVSPDCCGITMKTYICCLLLFVGAGPGPSSSRHCVSS